MVALKHEAPDFALVNVDRKVIKLSDMRGSKVVVAFFPAAFTGVCTKEMCTFQDSMASFNGMNAKVVGISVDGPFANAAFAQKNNINFPILSDYNREATQAYGVVLENFAGMAGYTASQRAVFVVGEDGNVLYKWVAENPGLEPDYAAINAVLA